MEKKISLKWKGSANTVLFNTPDGDLDKGQYCVFKDGYLIRIHPKNNYGLTFVRELSTEGLEEVQIVGTAVYDTFVLPDGTLYRTRSSAGELDKYYSPQKEVTNKEVQDIKVVQKEWEDVGK